MRKVIIFMCVILTISTAVIPAQEKFALVIGNNSYKGLSALKNPVNDASDIASSLRTLGFSVDLIKNANLNTMESGVINLKNKLSVSKHSIGFIYYAGHGIQSNGENFLIPSDAVIQDEAFLKTKSLSTQVMMDLLGGAGNKLNVVVLDACRDNPFAWNRSGNRGLSVVGSQPPGSIIVYATSAGSVASDGKGRNGIFTTELLKNIKKNNLDVGEVFRLTGAGVKKATNGKQIPAVYNQYFDKYSFSNNSSTSVNTVSSESVRKPGFKIEDAAYGSIKINVIEPGTVYLDGSKIGELAANRSATLTDIQTGTHSLELRYSSYTERKSISVYENRTSNLSFTYKKPKISASKQEQKKNIESAQNKPYSKSSNKPEMIYVKGGSYKMSSNYTAVLNSFYISKYEITQKNYKSVMGNNPSNYVNDNKPVDSVSWFDSIEFCNELSRKEGYTPFYTVKKTNIRTKDGKKIDKNTWKVTINWNADGYRLPTEAEWEYAASGGNKSRGFKYAGSDNAADVSWNKSNSKNKPQETGLLKPNELGIYDMSGNLWEWCWDWYGSYKSGTNNNPKGPATGSKRVERGGAYYADANISRIKMRLSCAPATEYSSIGIRIVRPVK